MTVNQTLPLKAKKTQDSGTSRGPLWAWALIPAACTFLAYLPVLHNEFLNWDDVRAIQYNYFLRHLDWISLKTMATSLFTGNWIPLTWLSLALDYQVARLEPWVYHFHNLILHGINTLLVFFLGLKFLKLANNSAAPEGGKSGWLVPAAFLAALLFGLHPLHVESVAWATERKDLLCGLFTLLSLLVYLDYASSGGFKARKLYTCFFLFLLALMSKPMAVTLPFILILFDHWPLKRVEGGRLKMWLEKIPFFLAMLGAGWLNVLAQAKESPLPTLNLIYWDYRLMNAFHSLLFYLEKLIFPAGLSALYPIVLQNAFSPGYIASALIVFFISAVCFIYRKKQPGLVAAWLFYLITLIPVLGLLQVGSQAAADRYTYLPSLGPGLFLASVAAVWLSNRRTVFYSLCAVLALGLGYGTYRQAGTWRNSITFWENVQKAGSPIPMSAYLNLGTAYREAGRLKEALDNYQNAIAFWPQLPLPRDGKGRVMLAMGKLDEAKLAFEDSIALDPNYTWGHCYLGIVCSKKGWKEEAKKQFEIALSLPAEGAWGHYELSVICAKEGLPEAALAEIRKSIEIEPRNAEAYGQLGSIFIQLKRMEEAVAAFQKAVSLEPSNKEYTRVLADAYMRSGQAKEAMALFRKGL